MSRSADIALFFDDQERPFRLGIGELRKLQEKCADSVTGERGPQTILRALGDGSWKVNDVLEPIRLGLIGGGLKPEEAAKLVRERIEERSGGLAECVMFALAVLSAAIVGVPGDEVEAPKGADPPGEKKGTGSASASLSSTAKAQPSDTAPAKSMN